MRTMLALTVVALTAGGCKSQKVIAVETDGEGADESEEPAELRAAREAAAEAERQAADARDEVSYQECLAQCESAVPYADPPPNARLSLAFRGTWSMHGSRPECG